MANPFQISLAAARVNANLTQAEAAEKLGVDKNTIGRWESGKVIPRTPQLLAMAHIYGVSIDNLYLPEKLT